MLAHLNFRKGGGVRTYSQDTEWFIDAGVAAKGAEPGWLWDLRGGAPAVT